MMLRRRLSSADDRGSSTLELVLWAVPMLFIVGLLIAGARLALANHAVQSAAFAAARDASLARNASAAQAAGEGGANFSLSSNGVNCLNRSVALDLSDYNKPLGTTGTVTATISCTVSLAEAGLPGLPGTVTIDQSAVSPVDPYRERS